AAAALRTAEAKYRTIFEEAVVGIFQSTPDGRYLNVNPEFARLYGYDSPAELMNSRTDITHQSYVNPSEFELFKRRVEEKGSVHDFECEVYRKDGSKMWLLENARAVHNSRGALQYYEGMVHDITQRKVLEEQLRLAQRLESVGRLAGGVAHDFNNILAVIIGYSQMLEDVQGLTEVQNKQLKEIKKAADRAAVLTRQLLAFSRKQILQPRVLNLNELIGDMSDLLRRLIGEDVELVINAGSDLGRVKVDPSQIEQVIMNLAVKRPGRHAPRRQAGDRNGQCEPGRGLCRRTSARSARPLRHAGRKRYRLRHGRGNQSPHLRALLHYQGTGQGYWAGALDCLWRRQAEQRLHLGVQRARPRHHFQDLPVASGGEPRDDPPPKIRG